MRGFDAAGETNDHTQITRGELPVLLAGRWRSRGVACRIAREKSRGVEHAKRRPAPRRAIRPREALAGPATRHPAPHQSANWSSEGPGGPGKCVPALRITRDGSRGVVRAKGRPVEHSASPSWTVWDVAGLGCLGGLGTSGTLPDWAVAECWAV